jgi:hypothetical protein
MLIQSKCFFILEMLGNKLGIIVFTSKLESMQFIFDVVVH